MFDVYVDGIMVGSADEYSDAVEIAVEEVAYIQIHENRFVDWEIKECRL
jgi:hypothetical protein